MQRLSSQLEIIRLPSDHFSCITTHLHVMAEHLRKRLSCRSADLVPELASNCERSDVTAAPSSSATAWAPHPATLAR
jgi:hypothetical protein